MEAASSRTSIDRAGGMWLRSVARTLARSLSGGTVAGGWGGGVGRQLHGDGGNGGGASASQTAREERSAAVEAPGW